MWQALLVPTELIAEGFGAAQQQYKGTLEISAIFILCFQLGSYHLCFC